MKPILLDYLCDPVDKSDLTLKEPIYDSKGNIKKGFLVSENGCNYAIINGIPRFVTNDVLTGTVDSFGDQWNYFNFDLFKENWLNHTVKNTFGSPEYFKNKVIVDAGAGSGMQSRWFCESGANYVISLELSHSVDNIMKVNLEGIETVDIVQCSIDQPPIRDGRIRGIVYCHNVIQHTPSVENTASELWKITGEGGEFVFNCYEINPSNFIRRLRNDFYMNLRKYMSRRSFKFRLRYSKVMSVLRFVPLLGMLMEKACLVSRGDVPKGPNTIKRQYVQGILNTFDLYGSHTYQHHKTNEQMKTLIHELQPDSEKILNYDKYFDKPRPVGCAVRLFR